VIVLRNALDTRGEIRCINKYPTVHCFRFVRFAVLRHARHGRADPAGRIGSSGERPSLARDDATRDYIFRRIAERVDRAQRYKDRRWRLERAAPILGRSRLALELSSRSHPPFGRSIDRDRVGFVRARIARICASRISLMQMHARMMHRLGAPIVTNGAA